MVQKKRKTKKKKPPQIPSLSSEEEDLINTLLISPKDIDLNNLKDQIASPQIAQALVARLPTDGPEIVDLILAIRKAFDQKMVQKAIRKSIFRLKQKGIPVQELESEKDTPLLLNKIERDDPSSYLGPPDGFGNRGIFIVLPQIPKDMDIGLGVVNDEEGIVQFFYGRYPNKKMKEVKDFFFSQFNTMVEVSLPHAATILENSYGQNKDGLNESSKSYLKLRPWIRENVTLMEQPIIYDAIPRESISKSIFTRSQRDKFFGHKFMESWIIKPEMIKPLVEEIDEAEKSPIHVSGEQKKARINEIKEKGLEQIYPESKCLILKQRLEEMAYILLKSGEEDYARLSLAAALTLAESDAFLGLNPVLETILDRSLDYYRQSTKTTPNQEGEKEETPSRLILP